MSQIELSFRAPRKPDDDGPRRGPPVFTVGDIVRGSHRLLDSHFGNVWVEGEVSNLKLGGAGHAFFTLKDDTAALPVAMWRSAVEQLRFRLVDGQKLRVLGRLGVFAKQGRFQMYADRAEPVGLGALMAELEQRKAKLAAEGLFDPGRKRPLPRWPRVIGIVTSAQGAAIHDILKVAERRCKCSILLSPTIVQGPEAPRAIVRALQRLARWPGVDVIILGRGGGSVEDLWAFNDERLARAIASCPVPIVSAVGHEVDVTISDLVADVRAATPSHAAELVVPDHEAVRHRLAALEQRLERSLERVVLDHRSRLDRARRRLLEIGRLVPSSARLRLRSLTERLHEQHPRVRIARDRRRLELLERRLATRGQTLTRAHRARLQRLYARLVGRGRALPMTARGRFDGSVGRLLACGRELPRRARLRLAAAAGALHALSPLAVLERGYAVVTHPEGGVVTSADALQPGSNVRVQLARGSFDATVTTTRPPDASESEEESR